jgi:hypothetical protein
MLCPVVMPVMLIRGSQGPRSVRHWSLTLEFRELPYRDMTVVVLALVAMVSLGVVAMCTGSRDH